MIRYLSYESGIPGPRLLVFGAIHGNEVCGARALERIGWELDSGRRALKRGRLTAVPVCNERAFRANARYVEENLNRVFHPHPEAFSYERQLANHLVPLVADCDCLLDLHSMQSEGEPLAFLNAPNPESERLCAALGTRWIMEGWPELYRAFPDMHSACTQTFADRHGIPNALIECGTHGTPEADEVAYQATLRALAHLDMIDLEVVPTTADTRFLRLTDLWFRESEGDRFAKVWRNLETLRAGEIVGWRATGEPVHSPRDGYIVFPSPISAVGTEWFYVAVESSRSL